MATDFSSAILKLANGYQLSLKRKIKGLSKGMRAKVSLSLALAHEPEVLILDEPTSGLDTLVRREFLEGMVDIAAAGRTVLLSSHQIGEVERVADIVAIIRAGKLLLIEKLETLKDQIRELSITLSENRATTPAIMGQVLHERRHRQQWQVLGARYEGGKLDRAAKSNRRRGTANSHAQLGRNFRRLSEIGRTWRQRRGNWRGGDGTMSATASNYSTASASIQPSGRAAGFWRMAWKEYRTIRLFWLSIIGLVVLLQWLMVTFSQDKQTTLSMVFNFALGAPAFFAVGCAGSMFAAEKEEGTFEFLRIAPVSAGQVLASKLAVATLATVAMFVVLWPLALLFSGNRLPESPAQLHGMLGLWLVGALEAIAWGTLFSLLGARPLVAVILAMVAASTCAHAISWEFREEVNLSFEWPSYFRSAPWRAIFALAVLGVDVFLGLRWLKGDKQKRRPTSTSALAPSRESDADGVSWFRGMTAWFSRSKTLELQPLLKNPDRSAALGHLLWQCWRQSRWLMAVMVFVGVPASVFATALIETLNSSHLVSPPFDEPLVFMIGIWASLAGTMVFLPDQEGRNYRFFAEHNTPPRYVWLTRQLLWMTVVGLTVLAVWCYWLVNHGDARGILRIIMEAMNSRWYNIVRDPDHRLYIYLPPIHLAFALAAVAYTSGQWVSMLVRSGILAGFLGLLLSAVLCGWLLLMHTIKVSFWWSVLPIPLVLLWATWLRRPIGLAKTGGGVRGKAAAAVLVPALALMIAVPRYRMHQIPDFSPGFDVAQYEQQIQANLAAGTETADMYRKAGDEITQRPPSEGTMEEKAEDSLLRESARPPVEVDQNWLKENESVVSLLLEASQRPSCTFGNPLTENDFPYLEKSWDLIRILVLSAHQLEADGKLDEALDRYFAILQIESHFSESPYSSSGYRDVFRQLPLWALQKGQTSERIMVAVRRLQNLNLDMLRLDEHLKDDYIIARRQISGDPTAPPLNEDGIRMNVGRESQRVPRLMISGKAAELLWLKLQPWERERALRLLNGLTQTALERLRIMRTVVDANRIARDNKQRAIARHHHRRENSRRGHDWREGSDKLFYAG